MVVVLFTAILFGSLLVASLALAQSADSPAQPIVISSGPARNSHSVTMLQDGRVLIAGGWDGNSTLDSTDIYDPLTQGWAPAAALGYARSLHGAARLPDGRVLVTGGRDHLSHALTSTEVFEPGTGAWIPAAPLQAPRAAHIALTLLDGRVLVAAGCTDENVQRGAEVYDPQKAAWQPAGDLIEPRCEAVGVLLADGRALIIGGHDQVGQALASVELYDPARNAWEPAARLTIPRTGHSATLLADGRVLVAGGYNGEYVSSAEVYDPVTNTWTRTGELQARRAYHAAVLLKTGEVWVAGGSAGSGPSVTSETYNPETGQWMAAEPLSAPHEAAVATRLEDGSVLVTGRQERADSAPVGARPPVAPPPPSTPWPFFQPTPVAPSVVVADKVAANQAVTNPGRTAVNAQALSGVPASHYGIGAELTALYGVHEITFTLPTVSNPYTGTAPPTVTFQTPVDGASQTVAAYYEGRLNGRDAWGARVYVDHNGTWTATLPSNAQIDNQPIASLAFTVTEVADSGLGGMLRVAEGGAGKRWYTDDGHTFLPMGDTAYRLFFEWHADLGATRPTACPTRPFSDSAAFITDYAQAVVNQGVNVLRVEAFGTWAYTDAEIESQGQVCFTGGTRRLCNRQDDCNADLSLFWSTQPDGSTNDAFSGGPAIPFTTTVYPNLQSFKRVDEKLKQLLSEQPGLYIQMLLVPEPPFERLTDGTFITLDHTWLDIDSTYRQQMWRTMVARWAAFPNVFWSVSNDLNDTLTNNIALLNEVGCYFGGDAEACDGVPVYNPWRANRPVSAGHLRNESDSFADTTAASAWHTYITAYSQADGSAQQLDGKRKLPEGVPTVGADTLFSYASSNKPVYNTEDLYEGPNQSGNAKEVTNPDYFFRRLFWSHLLSGSGATYGAGPTWTGTATYATGNYTLTSQPNSPIALTGLDAIPYLSGIMKTARIDMNLFTPKDQVIPVPNPGANETNNQWYEYNRAQVTTRGTKEILAYLPNDYLPIAQPDVTRRANAAPHNSAAGATNPGIKLGMYDFDDQNYQVTWYDPRTGLPAHSTVISGALGASGYTYKPTAPSTLIGDAILHISSRCMDPNVCLTMDEEPTSVITNYSGPISVAPGFQLDLGGVEGYYPTITTTVEQRLFGDGAWRMDRPDVPERDWHYWSRLRYVFTMTQSLATVDYYLRLNSSSTRHTIGIAATDTATQSITNWFSSYLIAVGFSPNGYVYSSVYEGGKWEDQPDIGPNLRLEQNRWYHLGLRVVEPLDKNGEFTIELFRDGTLEYTRTITHTGYIGIRGVEIGSQWEGYIPELHRTLDNAPSIWWDELSIDPPTEVERRGLYHAYFQQGLGGYSETEATYFDGSAGYDGSSLLRVGANNYSKSLLRFDVAAIPPTAVVDEATLVLFYTGRNNANTLTLGAHAVLADWDAAAANRIQRKTGVNWSVAGMGSGSDYGTAPAGQLSVTGDGSAWIELNITDLAQQWINDPAQNRGVVLLQEGASGYVVYSFCSEVAQETSPCLPGHEPKLTLRYHVVAPAPEKATFQRNAGGYTGNVATYFDGASGYNSSPYLRVSADHTNKSLLRFDVTSIPITQTVAEATLRVYPITRGNTHSLTMAAHQVLAGWIDSQANRVQRQAGVNWQTVGMGSGSDYGAEADGTAELTGVGAGWIELDVTDMVRNWVATPDANHGLVLLAADASGSVNYGVCSELGWSPCTPAQAPVLTIWHYPSPPAAAPEEEE